MLTINRDTAKYLIERDRNWSRFQYFCIDLLRLAENRDYVATALSADLGRDARTMLVPGRPIEAVICCSIKKREESVLVKAKRDLGRLQETGLPTYAAFCFNCEVTEATKQKFAKHAEEMNITCITRLEGSEYLSDAAVRHSRPLAEHYGGELLALRQIFLTQEVPALPEDRGLRIALVTQFGEDAATLRKSVTENLVLLTLPRQGWLEVGEVAAKVAHELHAEGHIHQAYLIGAIDVLRSRGLVDEANGLVRLNQAGKEEARRLLDVGQERLLNGREVFIEELRQRLPTDVNSRADLDELWVRLQQALSRAFLVTGLSTAREILGTPGAAEGSGGHAGWIHDVVANCVPIGSMPTASAVRVAQQVLVVLGTDTRTRAWLCQCAAAFVSLCTLGLHPEAQAELLNKLREWSIIPDTHVLLSFLCEGDRDHGATVKVLRAWQTMGRELCAANPVLEEAAYHAYIAESQYRHVWRVMGSLKAEEVQEHVANAFVRGFFHRAGGRFEPSRWSRYIENFRGENRFDGSRLREALQATRWTPLPETLIDPKRLMELQAELGLSPVRVTRLAADGEVETLRRFEWDTRLTVLAVDDAQRRSGSGGGTIVVSDSYNVRHGLRVLGVGAPVEVMSVRSLPYAMALTPGLSITLSTIDDVLFESGGLMRVAVGLDEAVRRVLQREVDDGIDLMESPSFQRHFAKELASELHRWGA
jgi:hypothetical protein